MRSLKRRLREEQGWVRSEEMGNRFFLDLHTAGLDSSACNALVDTGLQALQEELDLGR
jgi:hypothetical protein